MAVIHIHFGGTKAKPEFETVGSVNARWSIGQQVPGRYSTTMRRSNYPYTRNNDDYPNLPVMGINNNCEPRGAIGTGWRVTDTVRFETDAVHESDVPDLKAKFERVYDLTPTACVTLRVRILWGCCMCVVIEPLHNFLQCSAPCFAQDRTDMAQTVMALLLLAGD